MECVSCHWLQLKCKNKVNKNQKNNTSLIIVGIWTIYSTFRELYHFILLSIVNLIIPVLRRRVGYTVLPFGVCLSILLCVCLSSTKILLHFPQQLLIADAWFFKTLFIYACHTVEFIFYELDITFLWNDVFDYFYPKFSNNFFLKDFSATIHCILKF